MYRVGVALAVLLAAASFGWAQPMRMKGVVHIQDLGDTPFREADWVGTKGRSLRMEGFSIEFADPIPGLGLEYMCHLQDIGDTQWMPAGSFCGTRGEMRRLEGFAIRLT